MDQILSDALSDIKDLCDEALNLPSATSDQVRQIERAKDCASKLGDMIGKPGGFSQNTARMLAIALFGAVELLMRGEVGTMETQFETCVKAIHSLAAQVRQKL